MVHHRSMGKATFPMAETSPVELCEPSPHMPIPWKTPGMVKGWRGQPGARLVDPSQRSSCICCSSLSFAELMVLERRCGVNWDAGLPSLPRDTSQHHILLAWLSRRVPLKVARVMRAGLDPPSPPAPFTVLPRSSRPLADCFRRNSVCSFSLFTVLSKISLPVDIFGEKNPKQFKSSPLFSLNRTTERFQNVVVICHICYFYALFLCQEFHKRCYITASYRLIQHVSTIRSPRERLSNAFAWSFYVSVHLLARPARDTKMNCGCGFLLPLTDSALVCQRPSSSAIRAAWITAAFALKK